MSKIYYEFTIKHLNKYPSLKQQDKLSTSDIENFVTTYKNKFKEFNEEEMLFLNAEPKTKLL